MVHPVYADMPPTIFDQMSGLAREHDAINLGQGFPDAPGPPALLQAAADAVLHGSNQYPPSAGLMTLREAAAAHYNRSQGLDLTPEQVVVTSGATEALAAALLALVGPGDEVAMFQPLYDAYMPLVRRAGGVARLATLKPPLWRITPQVLDEAFGPATRLVILNNPMNPTGRVFDDAELSLLAAWCVRHDAIAICDEVWEAVVPPPGRFKPLIAFPGMAERTIKIGSAGKMFGVTGWKVGLMAASPDLARTMARAHQFLTFTTPPNLQTAVAFGLTKMPEWFDEMPVRMGRSRDRLAAGLTEAGFAVLASQATYFLTVDLTASGIDLDDRAFALRAVREHGVASIPVSALYAEGPATNILRLCFAKADDTLDLAVERLAAARKALS
jgi:aspartate/methionine/tyrosine aminotransferase